MRDENDGFAQFALQAEQRILHIAADQRIKRAERFIHEQHRRIDGQCPCEADSLPHTAGQLVREGVLPAAQAYQGKGLHSLFMADCFGHAHNFEAEHRIFQNGSVGKQGKVLKDHAEVFLP